MKAQTTSAAMLRTSIAVDGMNLTTRRLQRDYNALVNAEPPLVGVSAIPQQNDFFTWCCNIAGPPDTCYENAVIHLEMSFPETYPKDPPTLTV